MYRKDLTGRIFGRLTVLGFDHQDDDYKSYWLCKCGCPDHTLLIVQGYCLTSGHTSSCGCLQRELARNRRTTHGMFGTPLYATWGRMIQRCTNPSHPDYERYGHRGITVCDEWRNFETFRDWALSSGYDPNLSIDRRNNDEGYNPDNCRWADDVTQANNRSTNRIITYHGETHNLTQWSKKLGVNTQTLSDRIGRGNMRDFEEYFKTNDSR